LQLSPFGFGLALAVGGVGGLLGALAAIRLGERFGVGRIVIASTLATAAAWTLVAVSDPTWSGWLVFGAAELLLGLALGAENANSTGYRQAATPDHLQGIAAAGSVLVAVAVALSPYRAVRFDDRYARTSDPLGPVAA
jgi:MFS family permease